MIDLHTHLLPGVDDGSPSIAASLPVLERFVAGGVEIVACTPHLNASEVARAPHDEHARIFAGLRAAAPSGITLIRGWEIMLDEPGANLADPRFTIGDSNAVLVEFRRGLIPPNAVIEFARLRASGAVPIIAHPERYWRCSVDQIADWRRAGAVVQMGASAVGGRRRMAALAEGLLARGLVDLFASDTHGDTRSLVAVRQWLLETSTVEHADLLTRINAARLLASEEPLDVPPLTLKHGVFERLRQLVLGRN